MSAPLNPVGGNACCAPKCSDAPAFRVPGPAGDNAFTYTTAQFTMPAIGLSVTVPMADTAWMGLGQPLYIEGAGIMEVASISGLNATLSNTGQPINATPGLLIGNGKKVSPGGLGGNSGNAYTNSTANFTMPAALGTVQIQVLSTAWMVAGEPIFISNAGTFIVSSIQSGLLVTIVNTGQPENVAPTTVIPGGQSVTPSGFKGATGATGLGTLNSISPTATKGDLIVDNGANSPAANDVRLAAGSDGQLLAADSAQPTGLGYKTVTPNAVATDGDIAIFSGTTGKPMAVKDSKMLITSDGALQSTPTGGNARGAKAIDLQVTRAVVTQVASGAKSALLGGENNTASGTDSVCSGGMNNQATGQNACIGGGESNVASATDSSVSGGNANQATAADASVMGGLTNIASGVASAVAGGQGNIAFGTYSFCGGGQDNAADGLASAVLGQLNTIGTSGEGAAIIGGTGANINLYGQIAHASGFFAGAGDAQTSELLWRGLTTNATPTELFLDGSTKRAVIPTNTAWGFHGQVVGRSDAGVCAVYGVKGGIKNNAGTVTLIGSVTVDAAIADGGWPGGAAVAITADAVNLSPKIAVTGALATNIRWVAHLELVEVGF